MEDIAASESLDQIAHELDEPQDLLDATDEAPIIRLVNSVLFQAVRQRASDIHFESFERGLVVRYRIDGVLYPVLTPPKHLQAEHHRATENHGGSEHRGEAVAAGRPVCHPDGREGCGSPRVGAADLTWRAGRLASVGKRESSAQSYRRWASRRIGFARFSN